MTYQWYNSQDSVLKIVKQCRSKGAKLLPCLTSNVLEGRYVLLSLFIRKKVQNNANFTITQQKYRLMFGFVKPELFTWKESRLMRSLAEISREGSSSWPNRSALEIAAEPCKPPQDKVKTILEKMRSSLMILKSRDYYWRYEQQLHQSMWYKFGLRVAISKAKHYTIFC